MKRIVAAAGCAIFAYALFRTAWMCDDAFITLRTIDNFVHGYGLRWNVGERVQSFTHPLWLLMWTPFYAITREPLFTTIAVQAGLALTTMWLLLRRVAIGNAQAVLAVGILVSSKAFMDFSTSGLENPLTHLLLVLLFLLWRGDAASHSPRVVLRATLIASGIALCRPDLVLLIAPVVVSLAVGRRHAIRDAATGCLPFVLWELFSLVYYGSLVPNTALAKLSTGVPASALLAQGWHYFMATAAIDPVTVFALALATLLLAVFFGRAGRLAALGVILHALFILRSGGDFMSGRFLTGSLLWTVAAIVGLPGAILTGRPRAVALAGVGVLGIGLFVSDSAPLVSRASFGRQSSSSRVDAGVGAGTADDRFGVTDERRNYYPTTGLMPRLGLGGPAVIDTVRQLAELEGAKAVTLFVRKTKVVGIYGYYAGVKVHVVDQEALCDPFLARQPALPGWRIGHFERAVPEAYLASLRNGDNELTDPAPRALYDEVRIVTNGPIWRWQRFRIIAKWTLGR